MGRKPQKHWLREVLAAHGFRGKRGSERRRRGLPLGSGRAFIARPRATPLKASGPEIMSSLGQHSPVARRDSREAEARPKRALGMACDNDCNGEVSCRPCGHQHGVTETKPPPQNPARFKTPIRACSALYSSACMDASFGPLRTPSFFHDKMET